MCRRLSILQNTLILWYLKFTFETYSRTNLSVYMTVSQNTFLCPNECWCDRFYIIFILVFKVDSINIKLND